MREHYSGRHGLEARCSYVEQWFRFSCPHMSRDDSVQTPTRAQEFNVVPFLPPLLLLLGTQLHTAATESEMYSYMGKFYRMFEQAVYEKAYGHHAIIAREISDCDESDYGGAGEQSRVSAAFAEVLDTMLAQSDAQADNCGFEVLEDAMER